MNSKLRLLKDMTKTIGIIALTAALASSCGKSSEGDVFNENPGTSGTDGQGGNGGNGNGQVSGQTAAAWQNAKAQYQCAGYSTAGRMNDIVFDNVSSYGSGYNSGYNNFPYNGGFNPYNQQQQQQYGSGGVGIGVDSQTKDLIWVQDNGNGTKRVVLSLCTYVYNGVELIGSSSGISNQMSSFSGQVYPSNGCSVGGFQGSMSLYSQRLMQYQGAMIHSQFSPINGCN